MVTLGVYLIGSGLTAATPRGGYWFIFLYITRVVAGMGISGGYAAINWTIDEMIPARYRDRVDLAVNGTYWAGAFLGTLVTLYFLNHLSASLGWRIAYIVGPVLALVIIYVRRNLPESPRWLIMHGRRPKLRRPSPRSNPTWPRPRGPAAGGRGQGTEDPPDRGGRLRGPAPGAVAPLPVPVASSVGPVPNDGHHTARTGDGRGRTRVAHAR